MKDNLFIGCLAVLCAGVIGTMWFYSYPSSVVYACSDKQSNPPDVQLLCERLTQGQWWGK
jgi:hypothetical protein